MARVAPAAGRQRGTAEPAALPTRTANGRKSGLAESFGHALAGLAWAVRSQRNLRIHLALAVAAVGLGLALGLTPLELALLALAIALVVGLELANTALEAAVDLQSPEPHPRARRAKDVAAAAVLVGAPGALAVGALLFAGRLISRMGGNG